MAGVSLLALLDDIASALDDIAVMTKVAARKTAGVLGDDLALNAQQVSGVRAERELPVVWAVARGSLGNKVILVPAALGVSAFLPWAVSPLLMIGGVYLCFEGVEKLAHRYLPHTAHEVKGYARTLEALTDGDIDLVALEKHKIKGAIRTDFVLSAEITVIALGTVADESLAKQFAVLSGIGLIMTVGVYGLVAGIVKMDDVGLRLLTARSTLGRRVGAVLLLTAPRLMKLLAVVGTAAMFMVGGGILTHGIPGLHDSLHHVAVLATRIPWVGGALESVTSILLDMSVGFAAGALAWGMLRASKATLRTLRGNR